MKDLEIQLHILRKRVTNTQQRIFKIQYPSTRDTGGPEQHITIYAQNHFAYLTIT
jgi:hypothetical protein